jgi:hypothetical protein
MKSTVSWRVSPPPTNATPRTDRSTYGGTWPRRKVVVPVPGRGAGVAADKSWTPGHHCRGSGLDAAYDIAATAPTGLQLFVFSDEGT